MDAVKSKKYTCCGDHTFDILDALGEGPVSNCAAHEHWRVEGYRTNPRPPWPVVVKRRMRIQCVWCGAVQVVQLVPQFFQNRFVNGKYAGMTPAEVFAVDPAYVRMCAESSPVEQHHVISKEFLSVQNPPSVPAVCENVFGGLDSSRDRGDTWGVDRSCPASGRVLGLAEKAAQAGWREIARVHSDAGAD